MSKPSPEILTKSAEVIEERGHHKGYYVHPENGRVDVIGAMCIAVGLPPYAIGIHYNADPLLAAVRAAIEDLRRHLGTDARIPEWNDAPERTADEVTTAMRECAACLQAGA